MKEKIHPKYMKCIVTCACGNTFETRSTVEKLHIDICGACHPFFTGKQKFVDTAGRVEKFNKRYGRTRKPEPAAAGEVKPEEPKAAKA
jgi:large subunit ribosomal protein L31